METKHQGEGMVSKTQISNSTDKDEMKIAVDVNSPTKVCDQWDGQSRQGQWYCVQWGVDWCFDGVTAQEYSGGDENGTSTGRAVWWYRLLVIVGWLVLLLLAKRGPYQRRGPNECNQQEQRERGKGGIWILKYSICKTWRDFSKIKIFLRFRIRAQMGRKMCLTYGQTHFRLAEYPFWGTFSGPPPEWCLQPGFRLTIEPPQFDTRANFFTIITFTVVFCYVMDAWPSGQ